MKKKSISEKQVKAIYNWIQDILEYNFNEAMASCGIIEDLEGYDTVVSVEDMKTLFDILNIKTITRKATVEVAKTNICDEYLHNTIRNIL